MTVSSFLKERIREYIVQDYIIVWTELHTFGDGDENNPKNRSEYIHHARIVPSDSSVHAWERCLKDNHINERRVVKASSKPLSEFMDENVVQG